MKEVINRVGDEFNSWRERKSRLMNLSSDALDKKRYFQQIELKALEKIKVKFSKESLGEEEKMTLAIINGEIRGLERKMYPNLLMQIFRLITWPIRQKALEEEIAVQIKPAVTVRPELNYVDRMAIRKAGFDDMDIQKKLPMLENAAAKKINPYLETGYVEAQKRMDWEIDLKLTDTGVVYKGFKAHLVNEENGKIVKSHFFDHTFTKEQAFSLLEGRAIALPGHEGRGTTYMQLDLNDKFPDGNYRVKRFPPEFGYDMRAEFEKLAISQNKKEEDIVACLKDLANGKMIEVSHIDNPTEKFRIATNPQEKGFLYYGATGQIISKETAFGGVTLEQGLAKKETEKSQLQAKQNYMTLMK